MYILSISEIFMNIILLRVTLIHWIYTCMYVTKCSKNDEILGHYQIPYLIAENIKNYFVLARANSRVRLSFIFMPTL